MAKSKNQKNAVRSVERDANLFQVGLISFFTAIIIIIVRMATYKSDQDQFYWTVGGTNFTDFFSLVKSQAILFVAVLALLVILYKIATQTFVIKKSAVYIPMIVYSAFVFLSYVFSKYKEFALFGWNERFEGTLVLLAYMLMLFYIINTVSTEKHVKWIIYPLAITTTLLGLVGITQYYMADFFQSTFAKKLITPTSFWDNIDSLQFNFVGGQIYQTVFNPNYVSFYLTLLVPLFAMLFIRERQLMIKIAFGFIYGLSMFNLIGSASSNGIAGLAVSFIVALIILNKRLIEWKKPVLILLLITAVVGSLTFTRLLPQLTTDIKDAASANKIIKQVYAAEQPAAGTAAKTEAAFAPGMLDYFETGRDSLTISLNSEKLIISPLSANNTITLSIKDAAGTIVPSSTDGTTGMVSFDDPRFNMIGLIQKVSKNAPYLEIYTGEKTWPFALTKDGIFYINRVNKLVSLTDTPHFGFENDQSFGSYRGYIWSRSLPILKDTLLVGRGADTFCIYFPQNDYAGRYAAEWDVNIIVDKAHNMYLATALNTGLISLLALLCLFAVYIKQSFTLYMKAHYTDFLTFCGAGIFIGICGFLVSALFNDSSVSIMPLFYGLLGTGLAINRMLGRRNAPVQ